MPLTTTDFLAAWDPKYPITALSILKGTRPNVGPVFVGIFSMYTRVRSRPRSGGELARAATYPVPFEVEGASPRQYLVRMATLFSDPILLEALRNSHA